MFITTNVRCKVWLGVKVFFGIAISTILARFGRGIAVGITSKSIEQNIRSHGWSKVASFAVSAIVGLFIMWLFTVSAEIAIVLITIIGMLPLFNEIIDRFFELEMAK